MSLIETEYNEGDMVEHARAVLNKTKYGLGIVLKPAGIGVQVKWSSGTSTHLPSSLRIISKGSGKTFKITEEEKKKFTNTQIKDKELILTSIYGNDKKTMSNNLKEVIKWMGIIIFLSFILCFLIFTLGRCNENSANVDKTRIRAIENCVKITSQPLRCKEALLK
jgi:hypothetical protein